MMVDFFKTKMKKVNLVLMKKYKLTEQKLILHMQHW